MPDLTDESEELNSNNSTSAYVEPQYHAPQEGICHTAQVTLSNTIYHTPELWE